MLTYVYLRIEMVNDQLVTVKFPAILTIYIDSMTVCVCLLVRTRVWVCVRLCVFNQPYLPGNGSYMAFC